MSILDSSPSVHSPSPIPDPQPHIDRAARTEGNDWLEHAAAVLRQHLQDNAWFHTDDLNGILPPPPSGKKMTRARGAVIRRASLEGWCTTDLDPSLANDPRIPPDVIFARRSANSRGSTKPVWRSLIYKPVDKEGVLA